MIRATTFPQFMGNFCSLIKTRLRIAVNVIYVNDKGIQMESVLKLCETFKKLLVFKNLDYMAAIVRSLLLAAELARFSRNDRALLARCPRHIQSVFNLIEDIVLWSIGSCQLRYPPTSVTKLYRELKCRTHLIRWPVIDFNLSLFRLLPVFYINSAKGPYNE